MPFSKESLRLAGEEFSATHTFQYTLQAVFSLFLSVDDKIFQ